MEKEEATYTKFNTKWLLIAIALVITFLCYIPAVNNQFTSWDDDTYVTNNKYITSLSSENVKALLFKDVTQNYHHPVTLLSLAFNYHFSKLAPFAYYLTDILIHLCNVFLVYVLVLSLLDAMAKKGYELVKRTYWLAALCALWYGIHPMHVESVAWISERKDLLYAFFYFLGLLCYIRYTENSKPKWIAYVSICFILSCLSKPMGVVFPVSLFMVDILVKRKLKWKLFFEKAPLFIISIAVGILAITTASKASSVASFQTLTFGQMLMFPSYGFTMYTVKSVAPIFLSSFYPYPNLSMPSLPFIFYVAPFIAILLVCLPLYLSYKAGNNYFRIIVFGLGFYLINLVFVLQFVSVGRTIMSERYSYVSYFGLLFILVYFAFVLLHKKPAFKTTAQLVLVSLTLVFAVVCNARVRVWHSTETLWRDVAEKYPLRVGEAYESLGNYYAASGEIDSAYNNYKILTSIYYKDPYVFDRFGNMCLQKQDNNEAIQAYSKALALDSNYFFALMDRANLYSHMGNFNFALSDYKRALSINPNDEKLLLNIGATELNTGDVNSAIADFNHALTLNPNNATVLYVLYLAYVKTKDYTNALYYALKARDAGYQVSQADIDKLKQNMPPNGK